MLGVIVLCYWSRRLGTTGLGDVFYHAVVPQFNGAESVLLAAGILARR